MFDRWREWLKVIGPQLDWLLLHRSTFRKFISSGPKNADTGDCSDLIDLIRDGYIAFTGTTIRKMAETSGNQSICLGKPVGH